MITYKAAARTAMHWDNRGEYGKAEAILLLIKANLPENESKVLGAVEGHKGVINSAEVSRLAALSPVQTYAVLRRLHSYGLITRLGRASNTVGRAERWTAARWQAVRLPGGRWEVG